MKAEDLQHQISEFTTGLLADKPSRDMCFIACTALQGYLSACCGVETILEYADFELDDGSDLEHFWLVVDPEMNDNHLIINPTADQLETYGFPKLPRGYVGSIPIHYVHALARPDKMFREASCSN